MTRGKRTEKLTIRARVQGAGKRTGGGKRTGRGEAANPAQRVFDDLKKLVEETTGLAADRQSGAKKTAGERQRNARRHQAEAKRTARLRRKSR